MSQRKILILGTGNAQTDFIQFCKSKDLEVHSCSYRKEGKGIEASCFFSVINITDHDAIQEYVIKNDIDYLYSTGSDLAMPALTLVSENLNMPVFVSSKTAKICNDKTKLRKALKSIPEYNVNALKVKNLSDLEKWILYPAIMKPADCQGQRGINEIDNNSLLEKAFNTAIDQSLSKTAIIEEYVEGFEISINLYVVAGEIKLQFITERISFDEFPGGIIKSHLYPVTRPLNLDKINDMCHKVIKILKIYDGPAYFQVKIDEHGNPKIIECTPRLDGCHMWRFIKEIKGINLFEVILEHLNPETLNLNLLKQTGNDKSDNAELLFFTSSPYTEFKQKNFSLDENVVYNEWYYNDSQIIRPINGFADKVGYQIIFY